MNHYKKVPEYELGTIFQNQPESVPANLLNYSSFFEMGQTARDKLEASKQAQKGHRFNSYAPQYFSP